MSATRCKLVELLFSAKAFHTIRTLGFIWLTRADTCWHFYIIKCVCFNFTYSPPIFFLVLGFPLPWSASFLTSAREMIRSWETEREFWSCHFMKMCWVITGTIPLSIMCHSPLRSLSLSLSNCVSSRNLCTQKWNPFSILELKHLNISMALSFRPQTPSLIPANPSNTQILQYLIG